MYRWLSIEEVTSCAFKTFNRRNSVFRTNEYPGIIWEYPWISLLMPYEQCGNILLCSKPRFSRIFKAEHSPAAITLRQDFKDSCGKQHFDVVIIENISIDSLKYVNLVSPFGKLVCTYRYSYRQPDIEILKELTKMELLPWKTSECAVLPFDPKFNKLVYDQDNVFGDDITTSLGMVCYKPATIKEIEKYRFYINKKILDSQNHIVVYTDHHEAVNSIGLKDDAYCRTFFLPDEITNSQFFSLQEFCMLFGVDKAAGCMLLNELVAEEVLCFQRKDK